VNQPSPDRRSTHGLLFAASCLVILVASLPGVVIAQDLDSRLGEKREALDAKREQKGVLTTDLRRYSDRISRLQAEVSVLRNREAAVRAELERAELRLEEEVARLEELRERLGRSLAVLRRRLVSIYKSAEPDALTVILNSDGFDDLVNRYDYLSRIQEQDGQIVARVRTLRDESEATVERIRATRNALADRRAELERTRVQLETQEAALARTKARKANALGQVKVSIDRLEGDIGNLSKRIERQLRAQASTTTSDPLPAGPVQGAANGFIWPVDGVLTSPFGPRWGRLHAGIDIGAPGGTPIRATKSGQVTLAEPYGGYGNYTCVDHGGGLSSCYAHQSGFATSQGASVEQGEVIGYVGNTGASFGDHLHFEIRVNGTPVDPLGYLG
jgi:murein DD-endopeptidase MepM/ murein hydrolase activator NlpD